MNRLITAGLMFGNLIEVDVTHPKFNTHQADVGTSNPGQHGA
jgi:hypothetical protein